MPDLDDLAQRLPAVRRVLWNVIGGLLGMFACLVAVMGSVAAVPLYTSPVLSGQLTGLGVVVTMAWVLATATLFLRRRMPWVPVVVGTVLAVPLQLDSMLALLGAGAVVLHRDRRQGLIATAIASGATLVAAIRDGLRPEGVTSWAFYFAEDPTLPGPADPRVQWAISLITALVGTLVVLLTAWIIRSRRELAETARARQAAESRSETLETTASRLEERERLAQEVHDALSHRLSVIALHSGALGESARDSDPEVSRSAEVLRETAHRSLEDLRDLVGALREPAGTGRATAAGEPQHVPEVGLAALPDLIASARATGATVQATVMVQDAEQASDLLNRATFRIAQEALTNAYKHAPGEPIVLDVSASPALGVRISVANRLGDDSGLPGSGSGLVGMQERADVLGGSCTAGPDGHGSFVVQAVLPWQARTSS